MDVKSIILMSYFALISVIYLHYWWQAVAQAKKSHTFMIFNWFYLFTPDAFNEAGNRYRKKALICFILMNIGVAIMLLLSNEN